MATDKWIEYDGQELVNLSRTAQLAEVLGIDVLWTDPASVAWIQAALGGTGYEVITNAPWYDEGHPASAEFAGIVPLSIVGLDDSTLEATTIEYITDGGASGKGRNKTLPIVANVVLVASTERGADYGKRWLDRALRSGGARTFCAGADLRYFQFDQGEGLPVPPMAHRRDVTLSRGTSVTRKRANSCSASWIVTYTWTANDPFEYGEEIPQFVNLGGPNPAYPLGATPPTSFGSVPLTEQGCPAYDYTPIYDPLHPALVASPTAPDFYPAGWNLAGGMTFDRFWVRLSPVEPSAANLVPLVTLTTDVDARMVRVSIWPSDSEPDDFCDPLWVAIVTYLPAGLDFVIDGEQRASYVWPGSGPVRRADSLVYSTGARPMQWTTFNDPIGLLVTLDIMDDTGSVDYDGGGTVRAALSLIPKSD